MNSVSAVWPGKRLCRLSLGLAVVFSLLACVAPAPPVPPSLSLPAAADVAAEQRKALENLRRRTDLLLVNARQALAADRLMVPLHDNAYSWYQQVLALDELNPQAHRGMQHITARYLQLAQQAFERGQIEVAERMLQGAEKIAASPAQTDVLRKRYRQRAAANETLLPRGELAARSDSVRTRLQQLAKRAQAANSRLLIVARSDAEGRWIYQQMRFAVPDYRLRGNIDIGTVPRVVLIDL